MANLLQRIMPNMDAPETEVCRVRLGEGRDAQDFDLVGKLRDGSLVYASSRMVYVRAQERPWVQSKAEERGLKLAQQMGFDYVLVEKAGGDLYNGDDFLAQFYVEARR